MAAIKWIKIVTDIFDDEKMLLIESLPGADSIIVVWFKLLCLAGKTNNSGVFIFNERIPYTDEMLASIFRRDVNIVRMALKTFENFGMIEIIDKVITIPNWSKHQTLDAYERQKERDRLKKQQARAEKKALISGKSGDESGDASGDASGDESGDVPALEEDIEEEIEVEGEKEVIEPADEPPIPPTPPDPPEEKGKKGRKKAEIVQPVADYSNTDFSVSMIATVENWLRYKTERRDSYKPTGLQSLISKIQNEVRIHGEQAVIKVITDSMASNYQGIVWDRLQQQANRRGGGNGFQTSNPFMEIREERRGRG